MQSFMITLLICSVAMSVLALLYMAATPFLARHYSDKGRYYAWLIIVLGLLIPFRPQWGNALFRMEVASYIPGIEGEINSAIPNISWWQAAAAVWLIGVIVFIILQSIRHYRFAKMVRRWSKNITDERILYLLELVKFEMGITRRISIVLCPLAGSPMMIGLIKPRILLPTADLTQDELSFILKHELVHYKRKDLLYKYLAVAAMALHWFNPFVYLMMKAINFLCETSCDAEVLRSTDENTRLYYGETIIGVASYQAKMRTVLSTSFCAGKKGMTKRLYSIMETRKKKVGAIIACVILSLTMSTGLVFAPTLSELPMPYDNVPISSVESVNVNWHPPIKCNFDFPELYDTLYHLSTAENENAD